MIDEFEFFLEKAWSDGLPVVTPTEARLAPFLVAAGRDPDEPIGRVPPAMEPVTVQRETGAPVFASWTAISVPSKRGA